MKSILVKEMQILPDSQFQNTSNKINFIHALPHALMDNPSTRKRKWKYTICINEKRVTERRFFVPLGFGRNLGAIVITLSKIACKFNISIMSFALKLHKHYYYIANGNILKMQFLKLSKWIFINTLLKDLCPLGELTSDDKTSTIKVSSN